MHLFAESFICYGYFTRFALLVQNHFIRRTAGHFHFEKFSFEISIFAFLIGYENVMLEVFLSPTFRFQIDLLLGL